MARHFKFWGPVLLWMALIYIGSTDLLSSTHTSRFIGPFLRWFIPGIQEETIRSVQYFVRKCAHISEYAVLAVLVLRAVRNGNWKEWSWCAARRAVLICAFYACTDELHQLFEASRDSRVSDVGFDTLGAIASILILRSLCKVRSKSSDPEQGPG